MMDVRRKLAVALDVPDLDRAEQLAKEVAPWFGIAKVGLELYSAAGPEAIARMRALDLEVFADIKLHDIPTTVGRAARVLGRQGVRYLNFHAAGGTEMLRAGVEGLAEGARDGGHEHAIPIAVTVLTSDPETGAFDERLARAIESGCGGVVCSVDEIERVHTARSDLVTIVPGVRFADGPRHDQARVGTPEGVAEAGGNVLVVGRAVTRADDPRAAAERVSDAVTHALSGS
ncbi:MAG: orotidine-5-phosphate decarboxylase [Actinomycetota bacterium]|jgi:orotidine-5'-phosphate decarboxylase|nr:orotidine-5-phosphate decarboxylase [Actinomycetota bacterium]